MPIANDNSEKLPEAAPPTPLVPAIEQLPVPCIVMSSFLQIAEWNPAAARLFGFNAKEAAGQDWPTLLKLVPIGTSVSLRDEMRTVESGDGNVRFTAESVTKDGRPVVCEWLCAPLKDLNGDVLGVVTFPFDVSSRVEANTRLQAVLDGIPDPVYIKDTNGAYELINAAGAAMVGRTADEVLGHDDSFLFEPETSARFMATDRQVRESGQCTTYEDPGIVEGNRHIFLTTKSPYRNRRGELLGVLGISRDITEQKRATEELRRQTEILQNLFDRAPFMIRFVNSNGRVQFINRHFETVLGYTEEDNRTRDILLEMYPNADYRREVLEFIRDASETWREFKARTRDGRSVVLAWMNVALSDGTRIGFGQDVTARRQGESALLSHATQLQALCRRLTDLREEERRHLSFELQDEIGQILTSLRFALDASAFSESRGFREKLNEARTLTEGALVRIRELAFGLRPASLDHLGLLPALGALFEQVTTQKGVRVDFNHSGIDVRFDSTVETEVYRIVEEALTNVVRHAQINWVAIRVWGQNESISVQVEDEGIGFDPIVAMSSNPSGGLARLHQRVRALGGRLLIESIPGGGTHLFAEVPVRLVRGDLQ